VTLYLDSSAIIKVYLREPWAQLITAALAADPVAHTAEISYVETRTAFSRALREGRITAADQSALVAAFEVDWTGYARVPIDEALLRLAADLVDRHSAHALRAIDALHLAAAVRIAAGAPRAVAIVCWDRRLWRCARDEGFDRLPRQEP